VQNALAAGCAGFSAFACRGQLRQHATVRMLLLERICTLTRAPRQAHPRVLLSSKKAIKSIYQFFSDACLNLAQIVFFTPSHI
jgi:hypothetical protein